MRLNFFSNGVVDPITVLLTIFDTYFDSQNLNIKFGEKESKNGQNLLIFLMKKYQRILYCKHIFKRFLT